MSQILSLLLLGLFATTSTQVYAQDSDGDAARGGGSVPTYKNPKASIEARIADLLPRMTLEEKVAQLIQGDMGGWMNFADPLDNTLTHNQTGLEEMMRLKGGSIWAGYSSTFEKFVYGVTVGQKYLLEKSRLGIPAFIQSEGLHGFTNNGTIWPSPVALACSFNRDLLQAGAKTISDEAEGVGVNHLFAPVLDLGRELRFGRVEEGFGEDPYLTGEMGKAFVTGLQSGARRNTSSTAKARMASTCKHFAAFGSPQGGLNLGQVSGGERELQTTYVRPFAKACKDSLSIMTAYSSYDGIPAVSNKHLLTDILRNQIGYNYWVTSDAGAVDLLHSFHQVSSGREQDAKLAVENYSGEMGGGTYTYLTLVDQVKNGKVDIKYINKTVEYILRAKFSLGLFENPYPYADYAKTIRSASTKAKLLEMERETIVLLDNKSKTLPISKSIRSVALIGPSANKVIFGDYTFHGADKWGTTPLDGFKKVLATTSVKINYAKGCELWSHEETGFAEAVSAAQNSDVAVVVVGTWSRDQNELWQGLNATTGEHVDVADLGLVGAQLPLVKAIKATGKPTVVVFVSGKPVAEPWIAEHADAVVSQFYPGELGGIALAEVLFGDVNPSGKTSLSWPRSVGTLPAFYNYLKGSRPLDPGYIADDGSLHFGHQYVLDSPVPLWSFGHGLSYTTWSYSGLTLAKQNLGAGEPLKLSVTVKNTGTVAGKEVVQIYVTDVLSSVVVPVRNLVGFSKVELAAGASAKVDFTIPATEFGLWSMENKWVVEPGLFTVTVGPSDQVFANSTFTVTS
ncbi:hypothetical protein FRB91_002028 [Serendipita sp. 411]|nr:hypothetical protein FRB91_002028 [Serendipita sp. 411]